MKSPLVSQNKELLKKLLEARTKKGHNQVKAAQVIGIGLVTLRQFEQGEGVGSVKTHAMIEKYVGSK